MSPRRAGPILLWGALATLASACDEPAASIEDDVALGAGKADGLFGVEEGSAEARAILRVANESTLAVLDDDVGLDRRAAAAIVHRRDGGALETLAELDAVPFVGASAFEKLRAFAVAHGFVASRLSIATFNLRWYGLGGDLFGAFGSETRTETMRAFIDEHMQGFDVLVFQEVVDVALFEEELMPDHTCATYEGFTGKHQHVVVCHTDAVSFQLEPDDDDFALEALNLGSLRPGVHGRLVAQDGEPLAHLVAVHLKAREDSTDKRLQQAQILADRVDTLDDGLPVILIGDFNTHRADVTGRPEGDEVLMGEILEASGRVQRVEQGVVHTYRERDGVGFRLDQAWIDPSITVLDVQVPGACNLDFATDADRIVEFYDELSDHCPLTLELQLP
jgi:endonuclease/exonuclease/phosphatase family metal-dependent hydrolase